jgi:hypothetical protein
MAKGLDHYADTSPGTPPGEAARAAGKGIGAWRDARRQLRSGHARAADTYLSTDRPCISQVPQLRADNLVKRLMRFLKGWMSLVAP